MSLPRPQEREENDDGDEGLHPSPPAKRTRCSCSCDDVKQMELLKEMRSMLKGQNEKIESMHRENLEFRHKVSCLTADISRLGVYRQQSPAPSNDKYSTRKIEADDGTPLKVAIYDNNNRIITREPFSSMRVRMVTIHGDFDNDHEGQWTEEYFHSKIVTGRPGKEHLLSGQLYFRLQDGVGYLNSAKFQDNSSFVSSKRFKLGVMAADDRISERIQEGITESFAVKDVRGYATKKNPNPSPSDPVYKLNRIAMNGDRHKLLEQNGINTVQEFLCFYSKNPEVLRKILGKISDQDWDTIVNQAHKCNPRPEIYSSFIQERNVSHELEPFSRSRDTSVRHIPMLQKQLDVQVTNQEFSSRCNGLLCGASSKCVPRELDGIQVTDQQVSSIGNDILSVSSMDNNTLEGSSSRQPDGMDTEIKGRLAFLENILLNEVEDASWLLPLTESPRNAVEQNGELSLGSEAGSISYRGLSPVRGASSTSYGGHSRSPVRGAGSRRFRRRAGSTSYRGHSSSRVRGAGSTSDANTDFTGEDEISSYSRLHR